MVDYYTRTGNCIQLIVVSFLFTARRTPSGDCLSGLMSDYAAHIRSRKRVHLVALT